MENAVVNQGILSNSSNFRKEQPLVFGKQLTCVVKCPVEPVNTITPGKKI
jgi:hypothetical protein